MRRKVAFVLLVAVTLAAQQKKTSRATATAKPAGEAAVEFPIVSIAIEGSKLYSEEKLLKIARLKIGQAGDKAVFEAARERLMASGALESVAYQFGPGPENKGYAVKFEVSDIEQVYPVRFDRLPESDAALRGHLREAMPLFGDRLPGTKQILEQSKRAIETYLAAKGHKDQIQVRLTSDQPDEIYILFHPAGSPPVVAEVAFRGNKVVSSTDLQLAIHSSAIGIEYREARFREVLDHTIRPLYEQRGYVRVAFPKLEAVPSEEVKGLKITAEISEGETYSFGDLRVEGTESLNQELAKIAGIKSGELANMDLVMAAEEKVKAAMKRSGYMRVETKVDRAVDAAERTVDLTIHVTSGPQYKFGSLEIQGLGLHAVHEIKRMWTLTPGRVFNAEYPDYFLNRIREDGVFDNLGKTQSVLKLNDKDLTVAVTLVFEGIKEPEEKKLPR